MEPAELIRRGQAPRKTLTKHPYAAIEHRVIDSPAYASLTFSARSLLVLIARQLSKDNNGHLQATHSYMQRFGFSSEHTLSRAIKELIAHGMIYRTRSGGYQQGAGMYAVTWLPISRKEGLFLQGFKPCAWRDWVPDKKTPPAKRQETHCKNGKRTPSATAKSAASRPCKSADIELMPCSSAETSPIPDLLRPFNTAWIRSEVARLAGRGLATRQCFQVPQGVTLQ